MVCGSATVQNFLRGYGNGSQHSQDSNEQHPPRYQSAIGSRSAGKIAQKFRPFNPSETQKIGADVFLNTAISKWLWFVSAVMAAAILSSNKKPPYREGGLKIFERSPMVPKTSRKPMNASPTICRTKTVFFSRSLLIIFSKTEVII